MLVNKDIKTFVVRPSKEYLNKIIYYYPVRSKVCKQLKEQLSLPCVREKPPIVLLMLLGVKKIQTVCCLT